MTQPRSNAAVWAETMHRLWPVLRCIAGALGLLWYVRPLTAQVANVATTAPTLSAVAAWNVRADTVGTTANSISILINSGGVQTLPSLVDNRINLFPSPVSITTQWQITSIVSLVDLVGYFSAPAAALSTGTADIPSSRVEGRMTTGRVPSFTAFTQQPVSGNGTPGGTLLLFRQVIITPINGVGQRTDNLDLRLDLRGIPLLPSGTYRGTLTLRAVAY
jgi:hypothetical protein